MPETKNNLTPAEIKQRAETIKAIYDRYLLQLNELKQQQSAVIENIIEDLEKKKIAEIKDSLNQTKKVD